jgi:hypothetical protein
VSAEELHVGGAKDALAAQYDCVLVSRPLSYPNFHSTNRPKGTIETGNSHSGEAPLAHLEEEEL